MPNFMKLEVKLLDFVILDKAHITGDKLIEIHWETTIRPPWFF